MEQQYRAEMEGSQRRYRLRSFFYPCLAILLAVVRPASSADPSPSDRAMADALFKEAKALMAKDRYSEACLKLEESFRLDPLGGTLLNLAMCHEGEGKMATALVEYQDALVRAGRDQRMDRVRVAGARIAALEKQVPRLAVQVPKELVLEGLRVRRNNAEIPEAAWGTMVPVDPGEYVITATAPGWSTWTATVRVDLGEKKTVEVEALTQLPKPAASPEPETSAAPPPPIVVQDNLSRRVPALVVGGLGVAALGIGIFSGISALSKDSDSEAHCAGSACDAAGVDMNREARRSANIANVGIGLGLVGIGVGTWLWITSSQSSAKQDPATARSRTLRLHPSVSGHSGGALLEGTW